MDILSERIYICGVKFAKWENSIAVRIPAEVVAMLGIAPNEEAQIKVTGENSFEVMRYRRQKEAIEKSRRLAKPLPAGYRFNREETHERDWMRRLDEEQKQDAL
jgi:antitoxin MazE